MRINGLIAQFREVSHVLQKVQTLSNIVIHLLFGLQLSIHAKVSPAQ